MESVDGTVTATGMTVEILNQTETEINSGNKHDFSIQVDFMESHLWHFSKGKLSYCKGLLPMDGGKGKWCDVCVGCRVLY